MKMPNRMSVLAMVAMVGLSTPALATPIQWGGNGHYYELVETPLGWTSACSAAATQSYLGLSGHLATITSSGEDTFVRTNVLTTGSGGAYWLGGYQPPGSGEPGGSWGWVTGEGFTYTAWAATPEPNNFGCNGTVQEDNLQVGRTTGLWNDSGWCYCYPYVVEYESGTFGCPGIESGGCPGTCTSGLCGGGSSASGPILTPPQMILLALAFTVLAANALARRRRESNS